jgi:hypothetical protein
MTGVVGDSTVGISMKNELAREAGNIDLLVVVGYAVEDATAFLMP